jgi:NAD(P)-dependent dehydrogenase (short-subunit alcohol dehydrogenase family)
MGLLDGKVAIVTGAAQGIGRASALALAAAGSRVLVADINESGAADTVKEIAEAGGVAEAIVADVSKEAEVERMVATAVAKWGRLDTLMNNAHSGQRDDVNIVTNSTETWEKVFSVTLYGVVFGCKYAVPAMLKNGGGSIINVSSNATLGGDFTRVAYGAAKAGVTSITKYVTSAFGKEGIRCNTLSPGILLSPTALGYMPPPMLEAMEGFVCAPRMGQPEDAGGLVVFLASDASAFITGQHISVDGGLNTTLGASHELKRQGLYG